MWGAVCGGTAWAFAPPAEQPGGGSGAPGLTPEFLGRLDATVPFRALDGTTMEAIARKYLRLLQERAGAAGIQLNLPPELAASLCARCRGKDGARNLRRLVQTEVEGALVRLPAVLQPPSQPDKGKPGAGKAAVSTVIL